MFLENSNIKLRALEPEDLDVLYKWENDTLQWHTGNTTAPLSRYDLRQYIATAPKNIYEHGFIKLIVERKADNAKLGIVDLFDYDHQSSRAETGIYIAPEYRNCGYGTQAVELISQYALKFLKLNQIYCNIPEGNSASNILFSKCGYNKTAVIPQWIKGADGYLSVTLMQRFA